MVTLKYLYVILGTLPLRQLISSQLKDDVFLILAPRDLTFEEREIVGETSQYKRIIIENNAVKATIREGPLSNKEKRVSLSLGPRAKSLQSPRRHQRGAESVENEDHPPVSPHLNELRSLTFLIQVKSHCLIQ